LLHQKLADSLFFVAAERYFYEHQADFDQVVLYQIIVPYERVIDDIVYQLRFQELSFYELLIFMIWMSAVDTSSAMKETSIARIHTPIFLM
jgi:hypothetical protein